MKRYICIVKMISKDTDSAFTTEHSEAFTSFEKASKSILDHINSMDYTCIGFRIVELQEVEDADH